MNAIEVLPSIISFTWTMLIIVLSPVNIFELFSLTLCTQTQQGTAIETFTGNFHSLYMINTQIMYQVHFVRPLIALFNTTFAQTWCTLFKILHLSQIETDYWTVQDPIWNTGTNFCQISSLNISNLNRSVEGGGGNGYKSQFCMISLNLGQNTSVLRKNPSAL